LVLIYFGLFQKGVPLFLQPGVQGVIAALLATCIFFLSKGPQRKQ
jgi:hypothetical protein